MSEESSKRVTRRKFIITGSAAGAVVVWSAYPFADSDIGQTAFAQGTTGVSGSTGFTGTTGSTGTTGPTGGTEPKDKLTIKAPHILRASKRGVVTVPVAVTGPRALKGKVKLEAVKRGKKHSIGVGFFHVGRGGGTKNVKVHLNKAGKKALAASPSIPARITLSAKGAATKHKAVVIKAKKP